MVGYPFINPGPIGGAISAAVDAEVEGDVDTELYVRWWQLSTFMPVVNFHQPPDQLPFDQVISIRPYVNVRCE